MITRDQILAMSAGRELDELIATRVMGWRWWRFQPYTYGVEKGEDGATRVESEPAWAGSRKEQGIKPPYRFLAIAPQNDHPLLLQWDAVVWDGKEELEVVQNEPIPRYSTDIAAAWLVIEKLAISNSVTVQNCCRSENKEWCVVVSSDDPDSDAIEEGGGSLSFAICRAGLLTTLEKTK